MLPDWSLLLWSSVNIWYRQSCARWVAVFLRGYFKLQIWWSVPTWWPCEGETISSRSSAQLDNQCLGGLTWSGVIFWEHSISVDSKYQHKWNTSAVFLTKGQQRRGTSSLTSVNPDPSLSWKLISQTLFSWLLFLIHHLDLSFHFLTLLPFILLSFFTYFTLIGNQ